MSDDKITICAVGDIMLGDTPASYGFGVGAAIRKHGPVFPFERVATYLKSADIAIGNLETVISAFDTERDSFTAIQLRAQPDSVKGLVTAGFDILSVATNHTMQHGRQALEETLDILMGANIAFTGVEIPEKDITNAHILEIHNIKIGFLAYNLRPQQYFVDQPLWKEPTLEIMKQEVADLRKQADCIVLSLHWGDEYIEYPSLAQIRMAHALIDSGVNIILGHHPHILQGIEKYNGGVIAYSLGNFVFDKWQRRLRESIILKCYISPPGIDFEIVPIYINRRHQPELLADTAASKLIAKMAKLSSKISNGDIVQEDYDRKLNRNYIRYRREVYWHYLTSFHRYNSGRLISNFIGTIKKRIS